MAMVRLEPAGRAIVPDATPAAMGMLNTRGVGMSGAVTSATKVATADADKSALSRSRASGGRRPIPVGDRDVELYGPADRHGGRGRRHGNGKASQRHHDRLVTR